MVSRSELVGASTPEALAEYGGRNAPEVRRTRHGHGHGPGQGTEPMESVREATYRGHQITIRTSYRIEVDGVPLEGHMAVTNDGRVHYHAMPNVSFGSAVDLVKQLIDAFPDDFGSASEQQELPADDQPRRRAGRSPRLGRRTEG